MIIYAISLLVSVSWAMLERYRRQRTQEMCTHATEELQRILEEIDREEEEDTHA